MFCRIPSVVLALALLVSAAPQRSHPLPRSQCNTGALHCCDTVTTPQAYTEHVAAGGLLAQLLGSIEGTIGVSCSTVNVIAASGNDCSAQPACCTGDTFNGLVTLGCTPVNVNI